MLIVIPTAGRATRQTTYGNLPYSIRNKVHLVVYQNEFERYKLNDAQFIIHPLAYPTGIAHKRQFILDWALYQGHTKVVMLDDDLTFARRRKDDPTKFVQAQPADIEEMFKQIDFLLNEYSMVGVAGREGANRNIQDYLYNTRLMRVLAYRADILHEQGIKATVADVMNDFGVVLELLTRGIPVCNINWIVQNQHGSDTSGGCSTYRTAERQTAAALELKRLFPQYVTVVEKETKTAWGGKPRTDVIIQWKKAFAEGTHHA